MEPSGLTDHDLPIPSQLEVMPDGAVRADRPEASHQVAGDLRRYRREERENKSRGQCKLPEQHHQPSRIYAAGVYKANLSRFQHVVPAELHMVPKSVRMSDPGLCHLREHSFPPLKLRVFRWIMPHDSQIESDHPFFSLERRLVLEPTRTFAELGREIRAFR